ACIGADRDVTALSAQIIQWIGAPAASWARALWSWLMSNRRDVPGSVVHALACSLPLEEGFALAQEWAAQATDAKEKKERLFLLRPFKNPGAIPMIEDW